MIQADELGAYTLADDEFLDVQSITDAMMTSAQSLTELAIRFFLNLAVCWILVHFFYYRKSRRRDYYFTFMVFSSAILMLLYMMGNVEVGVGLTLGLFAIFGVIRYRTETVPIREMTYLFVIIALAAMNGLAPIYKLVGAGAAGAHYVLDWGATGVAVVANALVVGLVWILESERLLRHSSAKLVLYDRIELIVPERRAELVADLEKRLGVKVDSLEVGVGLTLGLFAIFGVIRYRTETVPIREMTYLFVIIALAAMNGLAPLYHVVGATGPAPHYALNGGALLVTLLSNLLVVALIWVLENEKLLGHTSTKLVLYDRIDLIVPEKRAELIADLEKRVGVKVDNLEVGHVDFLRDAAYIKVFYTLDKGQTGSIDQITRAKDFVEQ